MAQELVRELASTAAEQPSRPEQLVRDFYHQAESITDPRDLFGRILQLRFTPAAADNLSTTELLLLLAEQYPANWPQPLQQLNRLVAFAGMYDLEPAVVQELLTPMDYDTFMTYVRDTGTDQLWQRRIHPVVN